MPKPLHPSAHEETWLDFSAGASLFSLLLVCNPDLTPLDAETVTSVSPCTHGSRHRSERRALHTRAAAHARARRTRAKSKFHRVGQRIARLCRRIGHQRPQQSCAAATREKI